MKRSGEDGALVVHTILHPDPGIPLAVTSCVRRREEEREISGDETLDSGGRLLKG